MGRGRSGLAGGKSSAAAKANTPSGIDHDTFMKMSEAQRWQTIDDIIQNPNITVPDYLDGSDTSKVMYALGMNNKPNVVSDEQLDSMPGQEIFRTVYEKGSMPPPSAADIADQIRNGDFTQLSGAGGSAHGRALYFANEYSNSAMYGWGERNATVMRAKINPGANIISESSLDRQMIAKGYSPKSSSWYDEKSLFAISQGIDGWTTRGGYTMLLNRGVLNASSKNKSIATHGQNKKGKLRPGSDYAYSWATAQDMN